MSKKIIFGLCFLFFLQLIFYSQIYSQQIQSFDGSYRNGNTIARLRMTIIVPNSTGNGSFESWRLDRQSNGTIVRRKLESVNFRFAPNSNPRYVGYLECFNPQNTLIYMARIIPNTNPRRVELRILNPSQLATFQSDNNIDQILVEWDKQIGDINRKFYQTLDNKTQNLRNMKESSAFTSEIIKQAKAKIVLLKPLADRKRNNDNTVSQDLIRIKSDLDKLIRQAKGLISNCEYEELKETLTTVNEIMSSLPFLLLVPDKGGWNTSVNNARKEIADIDQLKEFTRQIKEIDDQLSIVLRNIIR